MKEELKKSFEFAIDNIVKFGDTDIFPFPIENMIFYDKKENLLNIFEEIYKDFDSRLARDIPYCENTLVSVGYTGFRWATEMEPIWNAYLLGITLYLSKKIEKIRIKKDENIIFSYRIKIDEETKTIFDEKYGWRKFQEESLEKAKKYKFVLSCDISNFYSSIYHHRLENSLQLLEDEDKSISHQIIEILNKFSKNKSYGLPVGGQAARILAELLLSRTDQLLFDKEIPFCRFVDDYHLFANTEQELYEHLLYLSKMLIINEGLFLQKSKTSIVTAEEFIANSVINNENIEKNARGIFAISLKYDPYSLTADEDYENLKKEISELDVMNILSAEFSKTRIHASLVKKTISTLRYLDGEKLEQIIDSLLMNLEILVPILPNVLLLFGEVFDKLSSELKERIINTLLILRKKGSYLLKIDLNLHYVLRLFSKQWNQRVQIEVTNIFENTDSILMKRDIILMMAKWGMTHKLSDIKNYYETLPVMEKRAFIMASYYLGDEGHHWRDSVKNTFTDIDKLYRDWMADKKQQKGWVLPI